MKGTKELFIATILAILATFIVYWKIPVKGLVPFPGDLLAGRFFPFNTMEWEGYPLGVPYKEFINADVVRQLYPFRDVSIELLKQGRLPLWNPYSFSGSPLLANVQSAPFYPANVIYWLTGPKTAWIIGVLLQPVLAFVFMWMFVRGLGLSGLASALSSMAFAFMGYMVIWWELNTVGHAALWLPFILWGIDSWSKTAKRSFLLPVVAGLSASLLAGHLQTSLYVFLVALFYCWYRVRGAKERKARRLLPLAAGLLLALVISSVQTIPALRFSALTPRGTQADTQIFEHFTLPWEHLATVFAPDYFGNPAVKNFWGKDYGEFMGYFGVVALSFAATALLAKKNPNVRFFGLLAVLALAFALPTPLPRLLRASGLPVLSNSAPARIIFISQFAFAVLAGMGADMWMKGTNKARATTVLLAVLYGALWVIAGFGRWRAVDPGTAANWSVTIRNLILPTGVFLATVLLFTLATTLKWGDRFKKAGVMGLLALALLEYSYFGNKFQTFSEPRFFFPDTPVFTFLREQSRDVPFRFFGDYTSTVDSNAWMPYRIYGVEGYDSLYIRRYGELLAASQDGVLPENVPRSDANLIKNQDDLRRRRLQDLMGVRFILDKNDNPKSDWEPDPHTFPPDRYQLMWQEGKFKVYENTQALPRAFLVGEAIVEPDPQKIIDHIFNPDRDLSRSVIVEKEVTEAITASEGSVGFELYEPNEVRLSVSSGTQQLLFLSDAYHPDWAALIDGTQTDVLRANYAFRAVVVPAGRHTVEFRYELQVF